MDVFNAGSRPKPELEDAILNGLMSTKVRLTADVNNLSSFAGQTNLITLFSLIAMMGIGIELDIPKISLLGHQPPLRSDELRAALLSYGTDVIPGARVGTSGEPVDVSFVLGDTEATAPCIRVSGDDERAMVSSKRAIARWAGDWPLGALAAAAAAAPEALRMAIARITALTGTRPPLPGRFTPDPGRTVEIDLTAGGRSTPDLRSTDLDIISGGAISTSALFCLLRIPTLSARCRVVEPETLDISNLNRYPLARRSDCGKKKAAVLAAAASDRFQIDGVEERFVEERNQAIGNLQQHVLVGVDDIPSRWAVQRACTGWLCVGATSHFYALVTTHESDTPCAGCAHPRDDDVAGPIPTISFVSFWAGLMQARSLLLALRGDSPQRAVNIWPLGLHGVHGVHFTRLAPRVDCPVRCRPSRPR
jgi:hypothetical protein